MFQKQYVSKVEETEVTFLTGSDQSYLAFPWRLHPPTLENWKPSWRAPLHCEDAGSFQREQLKRSGTGSANEKLAAPEAQPLTQSMNSDLGWSDRS